MMYTEILTDYFNRNNHLKKFNFFYDIETFQYNELQGKVKPSLYKNKLYSFAISYIDDNNVKVCIFNTFKEFLNIVFNAFSEYKNKPEILLHGHNINKYDNHFLRWELLNEYPTMKIKNLFLLQATEKGNLYTEKLKDLTDEEKIKGVILEKRVKSNNNLEFIVYLNGFRFSTVDTFMKTNLSLDTIGKKLLNIKAIDENHLKTDYNYTKYNLDNDLTNQQAKQYAEQIFKQLTTDELKYIYNDVYILAKLYLNYSNIFVGFDYNKITFTSNILDYYNNNNLTSFQLLNKVQFNQRTSHIKYTDYQFMNSNLYDYLKPFYKGGLNFYNTNYINRIINEPMIAIDINSSYPYVMHNFKIPTFLEEVISKESNLNFKEKNLFYLMKVTRETLDNILERVESRVIKEIIVKYYNTESNLLSINSNTLYMLEELADINIDSIKVKSALGFICKKFGSREEIAEKYRVKTQGKLKNVLKYNSPYDMEITEEINQLPMTKEEVDNSKVLLNGLYGIPALRAYFNLFRYIDNDYINIENGFANNERNIVFSIFVTSQALRNLLHPLKNLTASEIDNNFIYCDTDSLYLKKEIEYKLDSNLFHDLNLGAWSYDAKNINGFYVINHKKYCYFTEGKIKIRSAGIPKNSFRTNVPFKKFVREQFKPGTKVKSKKSIYNEQQTISIYPSVTVLDVGDFYYNSFKSAYQPEEYKKIKEEVKKELENNPQDQAIYIESNLGTLSIRDIYEVEHTTEKKDNIIFLKSLHQQIKGILNV